MADFVKAMAYVLPNEGGYTVDSGGPTNMGITLATLSRFLGRTASPAEVRALNKSSVMPIYRQLFWATIHGDLLTSQGIATCIFDTAVNRGPSVGALYAQKVASLLGKPLAMDGQLGSVSVAVINQIDARAFITHYEAMEMAAYEAIIAHHPSKYARYRNGWEARAKKLLSLINA